MLELCSKMGMRWEEAVAAEAPPTAHTSSPAVACEGGVQVLSAAESEIVRDLDLPATQLAAHVFSTNTDGSQDACSRQRAAALELNLHVLEMSLQPDAVAGWFARFLFLGRRRLESNLYAANSSLLPTN